MVYNTMEKTEINVNQLWVYFSPNVTQFTSIDLKMTTIRKSTQKSHKFTRALLLMPVTFRMPEWAIRTIWWRRPVQEEQLIDLKDQCKASHQDAFRPGSRVHPAEPRRKVHQDDVSTFWRRSRSAEGWGEEGRQGQVGRGGGEVLAYFRLFSTVFVISRTWTLCWCLWKARLRLLGWAPEGGGITPTRSVKPSEQAKGLLRPDYCWWYRKAKEEREDG